MMSSGLDRAQVGRKLCEIAADQVGADPADVSLTTNLQNDLGFDSLDAAEYGMMIEDEFDVELPNEDAAPVETVAQALDALWPLLSATAERSKASALSRPSC